MNLTVFIKENSEIVDGELVVNFRKLVMTLAWVFKRKNRLTLSAALKRAWFVVKRVKAKKIYRFSIERVVEEIRQEYREFLGVSRVVVNNDGYSLKLNNFDEIIVERRC